MSRPAQEVPVRRATSGRRRLTAIRWPPVPITSARYTRPWSPGSAANVFACKRLPPFTGSSNRGLTGATARVRQRQQAGNSARRADLRRARASTGRRFCESSHCRTRDVARTQVSNEGAHERKLGRWAISRCSSTEVGIHTPLRPPQRRRAVPELGGRRIRRDPRPARRRR